MNPRPWLGEAIVRATWGSHFGALLGPGLAGTFEKAGQTCVWSAVMGGPLGVGCFVRRDEPGSLVELVEITKGVFSAGSIAEAGEHRAGHRGADWKGPGKRGRTRTSANHVPSRSASASIIATASEPTSSHSSTTTSNPSG